MPADTPRQTRQLVLIGGGHAHVAVLKAFGLQPMPEVRLVLVSPQWDTPYSGMLPAMIAGHYSRGDIHLDLQRLCRFAGGEFYRDRVVGLDLTAKKLRLAERPPVYFDLLSIDTGSTPARAGIPGADQFAIAVKPIEQLLERLKQVEQSFLEKGGTGFRLVTVGGGAGGVELTLSIQHRLRQLAREKGISADGLECTIVTASPNILPGHNRRVVARFEQILKDRRIRVLTAHAAAEVSASEVVCQNGERLPYDAVFWTTNPAAPDWPRAAGLAVDRDGFMTVNSRLQSTSHEFVYAVGDVATMVNHPRPKSGVYAVRQGPPLARNLRLALMGFAPRRYRPQRTSLNLISTGDEQAVASKGPLAFSGKWVWRWKQRIDRKWMRGYRTLPDIVQTETEMDFTARMKTNPRTDDKQQINRKPAIRSGGAGAKLGGLVLHEALNQLQTLPAPEEVIGLKASDDAAVLSPPPGRLLVQSVSFFRPLMNDPWLFGRVAVNHALNNLFAMGAVPMAGQATATLEPAADRILIERLSHTLAGAARQLAEEKATLVGGHSAEGRETGFGLAVTGTATSAGLFRKSGLHPGDHLVLTKPLGTGVLFAADAEASLTADGMREVTGSMLLSNARAVEIFAGTGVITCTHIGGFGLLGHLREMFGVAEVQIELWPDAVPRFENTLELLAEGFESTMAPANAHYLSLVARGNADLTSPEFRLWLDPQTAGPLVAAVPAEFVSSAIDQLREAAFPSAAVIGRVIAGGSAQPFVIGAAPGN